MKHKFGTLCKSLNFFFKILFLLADLCSEAVQVFRDIIPVLGSDSTKTILNAVSPLLTSVELDMRLSICDLLDSLAEVDPSILLVVILVSSIIFTFKYCFMPCLFQH